MSIEEKYKKIEKITTDYIDGMLTSTEAINAIVLITHNTLTTEEFHQR